MTGKISVNSKVVVFAMYSDISLLLLCIYFSLHPVKGTQIIIWVFSFPMHCIGVEKRWPLSPTTVNTVIQIIIF